MRMGLILEVVLGKIGLREGKLEGFLKTRGQKDGCILAYVVVSGRQKVCCMGCNEVYV